MTNPDKVSFILCCDNYCIIYHQLYRRGKTILRCVNDMLAFYAYRLYAWCFDYAEAKFYVYGITLTTLYNFIQQCREGQS